MKIDPRIIRDIEVEIARSEEQHPNYPVDPLRRTAIMCEEAGEALQTALDLTNWHRATPKSGTRLRYEVLQTAAMAIKLLQAMDEES